MIATRPHPLDRGCPPDWASGWGQDRFGVFAEFRVAGVAQRMRWIEPGTFVMGSPEGEPEREDDEVQHRVEITEGFWLGDTPCTQAIWTAVMGENPSRFQDPLGPVEQVSWEDCRAFCRRIAEILGEAGFRLPTEAEWEYACRAGTETATYAGPIEIRGWNDAPVLDAIAWYGGNSGFGYELEEHEDSSGWLQKQFEHTRAGTRRVKAKAPNPWGLYDVLGNVWEWCEDWYGPHPGGEVQDPKGPPEGSFRVFRGGSWLSVAGLVRAASRNPDEPSDRRDDLGFRLARGQSALEPGAEPGGAERPARGRAERGTRRPALGPRVGRRGG